MALCGVKHEMTGFSLMYFVCEYNREKYEMEFLFQSYKVS